MSEAPFRHQDNSAVRLCYAGSFVIKLVRQTTNYYLILGRRLTQKVVVKQLCLSCRNKNGSKTNFHS